VYAQRILLSVSTERANQSVQHSADILTIVVQELPGGSIEISKIPGEQELTLDLADRTTGDSEEPDMLSVTQTAGSFRDVRND
jgi:hypothetical protein